MLIRRKLRTEEDRAKAAAKAREKQRKKLIKTKYGQKPLRHSRRGIYSCAYAVVIFLLLFFTIFIESIILLRLTQYGNSIPCQPFRG